MKYITYSNSLSPKIGLEGYSLNWTKYILLSSNILSNMDPLTCFRTRMGEISGTVFYNYEIIDENNIKININALPNPGIYDLIAYNVAGFAKLSDTNELIVYYATTPTPTPSFTPTYTLTPTKTNTPTISITPSITPSISITPSYSPTPTETPAYTLTPTSTITQTPTPTETPSITPTNTPSYTVTSTNTPTHSVTPTYTPSFTVTPTRTPNTTNTPNPTPSLSL